MEKINNLRLAWLERDEEYLVNFKHNESQNSVDKVLGGIYFPIKDSQMFV